MKNEKIEALAEYLEITSEQLIEELEIINDTLCEFGGVEYQILDNREVDKELISISESIEEQYEADLKYYAKESGFDPNVYIVNPAMTDVDESYIGEYVYTSNNQHIYIH